MLYFTRSLSFFTSVFFYFPSSIGKKDLRYLRQASCKRSCNETNVAGTARAEKLRETNTPVCILVCEMAPILE